MKEWKTAVENENELKADEKRRMLLSRETMEGLEIRYMYMHSVHNSMYMYSVHNSMYMYMYIHSNYY